MKILLGVYISKVIKYKSFKRIIYITKGYNKDSWLTEFPKERHLEEEDPLQRGNNFYLLL